MNKIFIKSLVKSNYNYLTTRFLKKSAPQGNIVAGKIIMSNAETNDFIYQKINSGQPFMAGRYGGCENDILASFYINKNLGLPVSESKFNSLCNNAGFFPKEINLLDRYIRIMEEASSEVDLLGAWNWFMEDYIIQTYATNTAITKLRNLEPWHASAPWSRALKGKRVLVVHPFKDSIEHQYKNRKLLFSNPEILPEFDLITLKAVQSIAGNKPEGLNNWFEALDSMIIQIHKINFDIAIIGCGAYGFPLAARIKKMNKQAIHLAGATQLFFGIKGGRWEKGGHSATFKTLFNDHWVRPMQHEKPENSQSIEDSCYW